MSFLAKFIILLVLGCFTMGSFCQAAVLSSKLRRILSDSNPNENVSVIIKVKDSEQLQRDFSGTKKQRRTSYIKSLRSNGMAARERLRMLVQQEDPLSFRDLWIINGIAVTVPGSRIGVLAAHPDVEFITLNTTLTAPTLPQTSLSSPPEWNIQAMHTNYLWQRGFDGSGIVVASMDTGVDYLHQDLAAQYRGGANSWFDPHGEHTATPYDKNGHGTAVMGVMVGGDRGGSAIGVAPGAQWIAVKLYNDAGNTSEAHILAGFQWLLDPDSDENTDDAPDLVNGSWGYETNHTGECYSGIPPDGLVRLGVQNLKNAGIGVVFSAGNSGPAAATSVSPANYPESISVGMINSTQVVDSASSRGPSACDGSIFPSLVAPGVTVRTADLTLAGSFPAEYQYVSGTSIAAPHVTGAMALLLSADNQLEIADLENLLLTTASDLGPAGPENAYGYGLVNLYTAYRTLFTVKFDWNLFLPAIIGGAP